MAAAFPSLQPGANSSSSLSPRPPFLASIAAANERVKDADSNDGIHASKDAFFAVFRLGNSLSPGLSATRAFRRDASLGDCRTVRGCGFYVLKKNVKRVWWYGWRGSLVSSLVLCKATKSDGFYGAGGVGDDEKEEDFFAKFNESNFLFLTNEQSSGTNDDDEDDDDDDLTSESTPNKNFQTLRSKPKSSIPLPMQKRLDSKLRVRIEPRLRNSHPDEVDTPLADSSPNFTKSQNSQAPSTEDHSKSIIFNTSKPPLIYRSDKSQKGSYHSLASDLSIAILKLEKGVKINSLLNQYRGELTSLDITKILKLVGQRKEWKRVIEILHWMKNYQSYLLNEEVYSTLVHALTLSEKTITASSILSEMHEKKMYPPMYVYFDLMKTMIKVSGSGLRKALNLFFLIKSYGIQPHKRMYEYLILSSIQSSNDKEKKASIVLFGLMKKDGFFLSEALYGQLILCLCALKNPNIALRVLNEMEVRYNYPRLYLYNSIMSAYNKCALAQNALSLKRHMDSKSIEPNLSTYNNLLGAIRRRRVNRENIKPIFEEMIQKGIQMDMTTYTMLIVILGFNKDWETLERVLSFCSKANYRNRKEIILCLLMIYSENNFYFEMQREIERLRKSFPVFDLETYNRLLLLYGNGDVNLLEIVRLCIELESLNYIPNPKTFVALIKAFGQKQHFDVVKQFLSIARAFGCDPTEFDNILLFVYSYSERIHDVQVIKNAIESRTNTPINLGHWNTIFLGLKDGSLPYLIDLFEEMKATGVSPNKKTYDVIIDAYAHRGAIRPALQVYDSINLRMEVSVYETLLNGFWWGGYEKEVENMLYQMNRWNVNPSFSCNAALLACYAKTGMWRKAEDTFQQMSEDEDERCKIDERVCSLLLNTYVDGNLREQVEGFLPFCEEKGYVSLVRSAQIKWHGINGEWDELLRVYEQVLEEDGLSTAPYAAIMQVCLRNGRIQEILEIASQVSKKHLYNDVEMLIVLLRVIPYMITGDEKVEEAENDTSGLSKILNLIRDLHYPDGIRSLLSSATHGRIDERDNDGLKDAVMYDDDLARKGVYSELRREYYNSFVDALWILGRELPAIRLFECAVERNMYPDLCYTTDHESCINLRQVSPCGARIVLFTWLASIQEVLTFEDVQNPTVFHNKVDHFVIISVSDSDATVSHKNIWNTILEVCKEIGSPFGFEEGDTSLSATKEQLGTWLLSSNMLERLGLGSEKPVKVRKERLILSRT